MQNSSKVFCTGIKRPAYSPVVSVSILGGGAAYFTQKKTTHLLTMATKSSQNPAPEDSLGSKAPLGACAYIYLYPSATFPTKEASLLSNKYNEATVLSLPLLTGLTVEEGFPLTVKAIYRRADLTSVIVKVTSVHREVIIFHNVHLFDSICHAPGLAKLCAEARSTCGYTSFVPRACSQAGISLQSLCPTSTSPDDYIMGVVVTEGFKERLYFGQLVPLPILMEQVQIGDAQAFKIPMFDTELFSKASISLAETQQFYSPSVSEYLYQSLFTSIAQGLRLKNIDALITALEKQFIQDHYKLPKVVKAKEFHAGSTKLADGSLNVIDCAATELAISYGLAFIESPQAPSQILNYSAWPIFTDHEDVNKLEALQNFNAKQAVHIHAQLFAANSILHLTRLQKNSAARTEQNIYNSYYLQHGLASLCDPTEKEDGTPAFAGIPAAVLSDAGYTLLHLAYDAAFSPHILAKYCYYLEFCQHQKSSTNPSYNIANYVGGAANSSICELCQGSCPASCIQTLFYRIKDRFPTVFASQRRDPYIITGSTNTYNDLEILGNFATFREKEDEAAQAEESQKYTYWQLIQTLVEKLRGLGITPNKDTDPNLITDIPSFLKVFKGIDATVDTEVVKFINSMVKNNYNFKDGIKSIHHVIQYCCNVFWHPPCSVFLHLFYRTLLTIIQDICLPACMVYEQENPSTGVLPSEWLQMHYQTLCTNFKGSCFDKGVLTGSEMKVVHDNYGELHDFDAALSGKVVPVNQQIKLARSILLAPKCIKIKNRIVFSNSAATDNIQASFVKSTHKKNQYIVSGPYMKFLNAYHRLLFPSIKMSAVFFWNTITEKKQVPIVPGVPKDQIIDLINYIDYSSKLYEDINVIDVNPQDLVAYAKLKLNNAIMRACGHTQFYITTLHGLTPEIQVLPGAEYPHILKKQAISSIEEYTEAVQNKQALTIYTTIQDDAAVLGRTRPVVTVPVVVNKYTGINGNAQIFQCGNLGYFIGRGVDKHLIPEASPYKKVTPGGYMRKRHLFMTPLMGTLVRKITSSAMTFEFELIRAQIQQITDEMGPTMFEDITLELVKALGLACQNLTNEDLQFYLGSHYIIADEISHRLQMLSEADGDWSVDWASSVLHKSHPDVETLEFMPLEECQLSVPACEDLTNINPTLPPSTSRKRKINSILSDIDL